MPIKQGTRTINMTGRSTGEYTPSIHTCTVDCACFVHVGTRGFSHGTQRGGSSRGGSGRGGSSHGGRGGHGGSSHGGRGGHGGSSHGGRGGSSHGGRGGDDGSGHGGGGVRGRGVGGVGGTFLDRSRGGANASGGSVVCMCGEEASLLVVTNQTSANRGEDLLIVSIIILLFFKCLKLIFVLSMIYVRVASS